MEPKKIKRLVLNKDTISSLDSQEQDQIRGGATAMQTNCAGQCTIVFCDTQIYCKDYTEDGCARTDTCDYTGDCYHTSECTGDCTVFCSQECTDIYCGWT